MSVLIAELFKQNLATKKKKIRGTQTREIFGSPMSWQPGHYYMLKFNRKYYIFVTTLFIHSGGHFELYNVFCC